MLEVKHKDILFALVHGIYKNRSRLHEQNRAEDSLCPHPACREEGLTQDVDHIFCSCHLVKEAWQWVRKKVVELLGTPGPPPVVSNKEILLAMFPEGTQETEVLFILGNYLQLVDKDVINKQKVLRVDSMLGVFKVKMEFIKTGAVPQLCLILQ